MSPAPHHARTEVWLRPDLLVMNDPILSAQVDELGQLESELAPLKNKIARAEMLRKTIRQAFEQEDAAKPFEAKGKRFTILLGPKAVQRSIDFKKLIKAIGLKKYAAIATCTLSALEQHHAECVPDVVTSDNTGARSFRVFELGNSKN